MKLVVLESPYAGPDALTIGRNVLYARECLKHSLQLGEAPMASHLLYTQALDDSKPDERALGIDAGLAWGRVARTTVVYADRGVSRGMRLGIERAKLAGRKVEFRWLGFTFDDVVECPECGGGGEGPDRIDGPGDVYQNPCDTCDGSGRVLATKVGAA